MQFSSFDFDVITDPAPARKTDNAQSPKADSPTQQSTSDAPKEGDRQPSAA
jgi:hypothetical protein